jgi:serine/threonine protein kinase
MDNENKENVLAPLAAKHTCSRINSTVTSFLTRSQFVSNKATASLPQLDRNEIVLGKLLGAGGFSQAFELEGICLCQDLNESLSIEQENARLKLAAKSKRKYKGSSQYVVKHIQTKFLNNPKKFKDAGVDLIIEAHFLASLSHPNILSIKGWASGGSSAYMTGRHDGFFIIIDRLQETLDRRIKRWAQQLKRYKEPALKKIAKDGQLRTLLFAGRLKVARDIASALAYLHDKRIIYRDLVSSMSPGLQILTFYD